VAIVLRHLEYLVALAREKHFGRAATACNVTQPTLSAALRDLEAELDVLIVERGQRFRGLTSEGVRVLDWAHRILADRDALKQDVDAMTHGLTGDIVIGAIPTVLASTGLLTIPFRALHPKVMIRVVSTNSIEIQRGLDNFEFDAGLTYLDNEPLQHVRTVPLYGERYLLVTGDRKLFRGRTEVTWAEAAEVPLCLLTPDMQNRRIVDGAFREAGVTVEPVLEANAILTLYSQIRSGATAVLSQAALHLIGERKWLRALPLKEPEISREIGLVYPDREPLQPVARALVEFASTLELEGEFENGGSGP
jgi:DNA-binding transcriptional LysR family regulator